MKTNKILNILIVLLIVVLTVFFTVELYKRREYAKQAEIANKSTVANIIPSDDNAIILLDGVDTNIGAGDSVVLSYSGFLKDCKRTSHHVGETSVSYRFSRTLTSGGSNVYLLRFKMKTEEEAAQITVNFGIEHTYYVTTEWREFYVPCTKGKINNLKITLTTPFQKVYLSDLNVLRYDPLQTDFHFVKNGSYNVDGEKLHLLSENDGIGIGKAMDVVGDGEYLYSAGDDVLTISKVSEDGTSVVSTLKGIGNVRHLEIRDSDHIAAASRETGVYIINVTDKKSPYIESYYDSLEIANDVCFSDNYMIIAGRYFGIEIVDVSDISKPEYITRIENGKECYRCTVNGVYLFVSCWATGDVEIYDISTLNEPVLINTIKVSGHCAEVFLDGNMAYIVSGYSDFVNAEDVGDVGYGTGNAVAIYDIADPKRPVWHSTIKTEGMLSVNGYDDWSVQVSNGYVYFTNSFGGLYVYNISNSRRPEFVARIAVEAPYGSDNFIDYSLNSKAVFPYNPKEKIYLPIMGVHVDNGKIYFATPHLDVFEFAFDSAEIVVYPRKTTGYEFIEKEKTPEYSQFKFALENHDIYRIAKYDNHYILATGEGLILTDANLSIIGRFDTDYPVKDVSVTASGMVITAETKGVGVYVTDGNSFVRKGFVTSEAENKNVSSIGVTGDGKFAVVQSSWTKFEFVDLRDPKNPSLLESLVSQNRRIVSADSVTNAGSMYYRNIVIGDFDGAVGIGGNRNVLWFKSENGELHVKNVYPNLLSSETNGSAAMTDGKGVLSVYNNGYGIYNPMEASENSLRSLSRLYIPGVRLKGKASLNGDILTLCNAPTGDIQIVNISDPVRPYLIGNYSIEASPGIALVEDEFVLVPVRHGGIIRINID